MKLGRLIVFGAGYVLGTRAGRARYESITEAAQRLAQRLESYAERDPAADDAGRGGTARRTGAE